jgi:predicted dehydrogenase
MRIGIAGYGGGGRWFHAPYIQAAKDLELAGVVTRSPERAALVADELGVPVFGSLGALLDSGVDAVTITTPPTTRRELVLEAVGRGVHVVADKPFAPTAAAGQELVDAAVDRGVRLAVFHNRRWDTDLRTLLTVRDRLGEPWRFDSRMDFDDPATLEAGPGGGLLRDLGSHLVDQALWLFGPVAYVSANLDLLGDTDAGFVLSLTHSAGVHSHLSASKVNRVTGRELRLLGTGGSYVSAMSDVQTRAVLDGLRPADDPAGWGYETVERWGTLHTEAGEQRVPSAQGSYVEFYEQFARAVAGAGPVPVTGAEAVETLRVLDAARTSHAEHRTVAL